QRHGTARGRDPRNAGYRQSLCCGDAPRRAETGEEAEEGGGRPAEEGGMSEAREAHGGTLWKRLVNLLRGRDGEESLRESIEELLEEHAGEAVTPEETAERALLRNVLEVGDLRVGEIRVPRTDIIAVPHDIAFDKLVQTLIEAEHSRLPIYRESLDDIMGMVHVK